MRFSILIARERNRFHQSSMRAMFWEIPSVFCGCCAKRLGWSSTKRCSHGRRVCATPTEFGRNIGIRKWQVRHLFSLTTREKGKCRSGFAESKNAAANVMRSFTDAAYTEESLRKAGTQEPSEDLALILFLLSLDIFFLRAAEI